MALFAAISVVLKMLAFPKEGIVRITFECLPIMFASIFLGPIHGTIVAVLADLLGCLANFQTPLPSITFAAAIIGLSAGLLYHSLKKLPTVVRIGIAVLTAHVVGNILLKSWTLHNFYGFTYPVTLAWRSYYLLIAIAEWGMLFAIAKSPVSRALDKLLGRHSSTSKKRNRR